MNKPIFSSVSGVQRRSVLLAGAALAAAPVLRVEPGEGDWPFEQALLDVEAGAGQVTAFRVRGDGAEVVLCDPIAGAIATRGV